MADDGPPFAPSERRDGHLEPAWVVRTVALILNPVFRGVPPADRLDPHQGLRRNRIPETGRPLTHMNVTRPDADVRVGAHAIGTAEVRPCLVDGNDDTVAIH